MTEKVLHQYQNFVEAITSAASNDVDALSARLQELKCDHTANYALLNTVGIGLPSEAGEFSDIVKKVIFHGKPLDLETRRKLSKELGDILWYWMNACRALDLDPYSVINENVEKLEARHPAGKFNIHFESTRTATDS